MDEIRLRVVRNSTDSPYYNTKEAAFSLGISWASLKRLRLAGKGPVCRLHSGIWLYHIDDLVAWLAQRPKGGKL
jgi:predicted site-specific integrase-resolvase